MKWTALTDVTAYRMHVPRWAVAPTSGAGAGKHGGRANRQGVEALYLAPSWVIGDLVIASGAKGILFPSRLSKGGTNLVIFSQMLSSSDKLEVFDPGKALPQTQASWS